MQKILVTDDDLFSRRLLRRLLEKWDYQVLEAQNGLEALELLSQDPDISHVITDWMMPEMNGVELCQEIRKIKRPRFLPIILLTSQNEKQFLVEGLNAGADIFLKKPLDPAELQAQLHVLNRILDYDRRLSDQLQEIKKVNEYLEESLEAAARIQQSLLPENPPEIPELEFSWLFEACDAIAGDMCNIFRLDETHIGVYILDVSGHGVPAALLSVTLSHVLTPYPIQGGILKATKENSYCLPSPSQVATELNQRFPVMEQSKQFFTFLYGIFDLTTGAMTFIRAGNQGPFHIRNHKAFRHDENGALPMGIFPDTIFPENTLQLKTNDFVLFYTDGIEECTNKEGEQFGEERLGQLLESIPTGDTAQEITRKIRTRIGQFIGDIKPDDDLTMVVVKVKKVPED
jgi:phosphoserine phosphatase RsbU/P